MDIPHLDLVKEVIGAQAVEALRGIFENRKGEPPSVPVLRFRADHDEWLNALDTLENRYSLIERTRDSSAYLIRSYALPLIGTSESESILNIMDKIYKNLSVLYKEHLIQPIGLDMLCDSDLFDQKLIKEALYYLSESHGIYSGMTIGFPYAPNSTLNISESVLSKKSINHVLGEYYQWHFVNPKSQITSLDSFHLSDAQSESFFFRGNSSEKPDWYDFLDNTQKALISEIDRAMKNELKALPTIGLRTLLETIMVEKIGDSNSFKEQVRRFTVEGFVTPKMAEALIHVLDAGNASAHRAYFPSKEDLTTCVELVKHLMHGTYILSPKVDKVAENTPKRGGG